MVTTLSASAAGPHAAPAVLPISKIQLTFQAVDPVALPEFGGSTLRGCLGTGLKKLFCVMEKRQCVDCPCRARCTYRRLYEPEPGPAVPTQFQSVPAPWVLEPEWDKARTVAPGESFSCSINLFGYAITHTQDLVQGFKLGVKQGIGKGGGRAALIAVKQLELDSGMLQPPSFFGEAYPVPAQSTRAPRPSSELAMEFLTPTRLQRKGRICGPDQWDAALLLNTLVRKIKLYDTCYWGNQLPHMPPDAAGITLEGTLRICRWQRYSSRQKKLIRMDGVTGQARLQGELNAWLPWLQLGQLTHLGKNTGFGLGCYRLLDTPAICDRFEIQESIA